MLKLRVISGIGFRDNNNFSNNYYRVFKNVSTIDFCDTMSDGSINKDFNAEVNREITLLRSLNIDFDIKITNRKNYPQVIFVTIKVKNKFIAFN